MTRTKYKRVPFDLELAKEFTNKEVEGRIVTRNGRQVRIICFDKDGWQSAYPIVALIQIESNDESMCTFSKKGAYCIGCESSRDLMLEVSTYYRDFSNIVPQKWQPFLVRDDDDDIWGVSVCAGRNVVDKVVFFNEVGDTYFWKQFLPISEVTQCLIGTTKSYEQLIKELDAELTKNE